MKKYDHLRVRAREWRLEEGLALQEICERLKLSKGTVYPWIKDIPLQRAPASKAGHLRKYNVARIAACKQKREAAYEDGRRQYKKLSKDPSFRDFVVLFLTEGHRRGKNSVDIGNSNPLLVQLALKWMVTLSEKTPSFWLQYHADQDLEDLKVFWAGRLRVDPSVIKTQRKSNSGQLKGRKWRSEHGVLTVRVGDTYLRCRLQAWMDLLQEDWAQDFSG